MCISRLLSEIDDVLGERKEVTGDDLDKMKYTEQVLNHFATSLSPHSDLYIQVIQEVLRMYPTVAFMNKESPKGGITLSTYHIPEGTLMTVSGDSNLVVRMCFMIVSVASLLPQSCAEILSTSMILTCLTHLGLMKASHGTKHIFTPVECMQ